MTSPVCVPFRPGDPYRDANWAFLQARWERAGYRVFVGDNPEDRFSGAASRNMAASAAGDWDTALFCDGDSYLNLQSVAAALALAHTTGGYVAPYDRLMILNDATSGRVRAGYEPMARDAVKTYKHCWPCAFAIGRALWDELGGMDAVTWKGVGFEDVNFVNRAAELVGLERVEGDAYHLFHVPRGKQLT